MNECSMRINNEIEHIANRIEIENRQAVCLKTLKSGWIIFWGCPSIVLPLEKLLVLLIRIGHTHFAIRNPGRISNIWNFNVGNFLSKDSIYWIKREIVLPAPD